MIERPVLVAGKLRATLSRHGNVWVITFEDEVYGVFRCPPGIVASDALVLAESHVRSVDRLGKGGGGL
jgi:hypothetical protein